MVTTKVFPFLAILGKHVTKLAVTECVRNSSTGQDVCELMVEIVIKMIPSGKDVLPFPPINRYVLKTSVVIVFKGKKYPLEVRRLLDVSTTLAFQVEFCLLFLLLTTNVIYDIVTISNSPQRFHGVNLSYCHLYFSW